MTATTGTARRSGPGTVWRSTTGRARCLLLVGLVLLVAGASLGEEDVVRVGAFAAALPVVAVLVVTRARLRIACARSSEPPLAVAGSAVEVVLTLTNRSVVPTGALHLEDVLPDHLSGQARFTLAGLGAGESRAVVYRLTDVRRGRYVTGPLRIRIDDAFGLVDVTRSFAGRSEVVVTPQVEPLAQAGPALARDAGSDSGSRSVGSQGAEDASIREYRHGDDLRRIHWRSTARTGTPMVRQDERPWQGRVTVALDTRRAGFAALPDGAELPAPAAGTPAALAAAAPAGAGSAPAVGSDPRRRDAFEWAVSAAASVATRSLAAGRDTGLLYERPGAATAAPVRLPLADARDVVAQLADVGLTGRSGPDPLVAALRAADRRTTVVAVLGDLGGDAADALASVAAGAGRSVGALLALLLDVPSWRGRPPAEPAAAARLRAAGWTVVVAHRDDTVAAAWDRLLTARGGLAAGADAARVTAAAPLRPVPGPRGAPSARPAARPGAPR